MLSLLLFGLTVFGLTVFAQQDPQDPGVAGPALEVVHRYYDQWPTGKQKLFHNRAYADMLRHRRFSLR